MMKKSRSPFATALYPEILACFGCLLLAVLVVQLAYVAPRSISLASDFGAWNVLKRGFYANEQLADRTGNYRWTNGDALLVLPNPGGMLITRFGLAGGRNRSTSVVLKVGQRENRFTVGPDLRRYVLLLPPQPEQQVAIALASETFSAPSDQRLLGVVVTSVDVTGGGLAPWHVLLALALLAGALYILVRFAGFARWFTLAFVVAVSMLAGVWLYANWQTPHTLNTIMDSAGVFGMVFLGIAAGRGVLRSPTVRTLAARTAFRSRWLGRTTWHLLRQALSQPAVIVSCITLSSVVASYRLFSLITVYAVNVLFWDQWDYYRPLFAGEGIWGMIVYQHGPHRQGLGGAVLDVSAQLTSLNSRADAFVIGGILVLAALAGLALKWCLFGRFSIIDAFFPLIFLSTSHIEAITTVPNPAHGALPLLLTMLYALAWMLPRPLWRYSALVVLNLALVFTGFGIFMGLITPALLALDFGWQLRYGEGRSWRGPLLAFGGALLAIFAFSIGYKFDPVISCFVFPDPRPWQYPWFMGLMFVRFFGLRFAAAPLAVTLFSAGLLLLFISIALHHAILVIRSGVAASPLSRTILVLIGFSLLFSANSAVGRVCAGVDAGQTSRYMALVAPAFVGLYLHVLSMRIKPLRFVLIAVFVTLLLPIPFPGRIDEVEATAAYAFGKQRWKACYLATEQAVECSRTTGFPIYLAPSVLRERLAYLKAQRLNLFNGQ